MHQVSRHEEMLYEMDTKMFIMNKTIQDIMIGMIVSCNMNPTYWPIFKPKFLGYIHHSMFSREMLTHCMNI